MDHSAPVIGITSNLVGGRFTLRREYEAAVRHAGGTPIVLAPPIEDDPDQSARAHLDLCDAIILSGGDDPATEAFGEPSHPRATLIHPDRQRFEVALLGALEHRPDLPVLGICLGMQLMALTAGGRLDQHMPDTMESHQDHGGDRTHPVLASIDLPTMLAPDSSRVGESLGEVTSWHRQRVIDSGSLRIVARAADGVVEAIDDPARPFYLGVQWHPERTTDHQLGPALFERLISATRHPALQPTLR